jgi:fumarate hydratase subunit alpha
MRPDVVALLKKAHQSESDQKAKKALLWIIENARIARKENLALCQDTGFPILFIEAGNDVALSAALIDAFKKGISDGYQNNFLRPSIVDPLARGWSSYKGVEYHIEFIPYRKGFKITVLPKGFGSENKTQLKMFNPTVSFSSIEDFIVESVRSAGPEACPPFIVGVGIGGTAEGALLSAKKALLTDMHKSSDDKEITRKEARLLKKINALKIGPMGLGGRTTCLAVKILTTPTHIAGLPVAVNISCWALRSATVTVNK